MLNDIDRFNYGNMNWRIIETGFNDAYMNMAIDAALAGSISQKDYPIIRFFEWAQPSISIGYSQSVKDVLNIELCKQENIQFVRRPTGGGVVFHVNDITYSSILPKGSVKDIYEAYALIQSHILNGLISIGVEAELYDKIRKPDLQSHCFVTPNFGDIISAQKKLGGLAARKIKGNILCQGYIYSGDASYMTKYCHKKLQLDRNAISLDALGIERENAKKSIKNNWQDKLIKSSLSEQEQGLAGILYESTYSTDEWNYKR